MDYNHTTELTPQSGASPQLPGHSHTKADSGQRMQG